MPSSGSPIARIRLARSLPRLLRPTLVLLLVAAGAVAVAMLAPMALDPVIRLALVVAAALLGLAGIWLGLRMLSVRLEVEEAALRVSWLGGERTYALTPGPVTRVRLEGEHASSLRARSDILGWSFGRARLRGEETIDVVRLAPTATAILVPTERGRLAIAPRDEGELLDALARAARARQRLEDLVADDDQRGAAEVAEVPVGEGVAHGTDSVVVDVSAGETGATVGTREPEPPPRLLTGIERAMLEAERARQLAQADARVAAETDRRELGGTARMDAADGSASATPEVPQRSAARRPWSRGERGSIAAPDLTETAAAPEVVASGAEVAVRAPRTRRRLAITRPSVAFVLLPLVASGAVWGIASLIGRLPDGGTDLARIASLGLVLSGPTTSVGAIMARAWWPRLVGVVVAGGLVATAFIGRALLGPLN